MSFKERKAARKKYYEENIKHFKLTICVSCSGSGWYDSLDENGNSIKCGQCNGTGKERTRRAK